MKIFDINVQEPYFSSIVSGKKTVEGRLNKGKFFDLQVGYILKINGNVEYLVTTKNIYPGFREMIVAEGLKNVIPDKKTTEEALSVYYKFFSKEDELKYGVVGIKITKKD